MSKLTIQNYITFANELLGAASGGDYKERPFAGLSWNLVPNKNEVGLLVKSMGETIGYFSSDISIGNQTDTVIELLQDEIAYRRENQLMPLKAAS